MVFPRPVRAVVFDMDGLLIDTEGLVRAGSKLAARRFGRDLPDAVSARMIGLPGKDCEAMLAEHFGPDFPLERYLEEERRQVTALFAEGVALKAGVTELLDHLDALGLPRAVATSSSRAAASHHLGAHGLYARFDAVIAREDVPRHKPHPEPFLAAAAAIGVAPGACLALEDSHNGVRAAHAAGMMTVMVPDLLHPTEEMDRLCIHIAESLHEVLRLLQTGPGGA